MANFFLKNYKKPYFILGFALFWALFLISIRSQNPIKELEYKTIDFRFRAFPSVEMADKDIILVTIDDYSLQEFGNNGISWPWPRDFYYVILQYLQQAEAKTVLFDILFYEADIDRAEYAPGYTDKRFAEAITESKNVILAAELTMNETEHSISLEQFHLQPSISNGIQPFRGAVLPIPILSKAAEAIGVVNIRPDSDGIVRRVPYFYEYDGNYLPQMALAGILHDEEMSNLTIPENNEHFVFWYGAGGADNPFTYIPFFALVQSYYTAQSGAESLLPADFFKDKIVLIGSTASGTIRDVISTPYPQATPGMELWATVFSNIRNNHQILFLPVLVIGLLLFGLVAGGYFIFCRFYRFREQLLFLIIPILYSVFVLLGWKYAQIWLPVVSPLIAFFITFLFLLLMSYFSEGKAKIEIQKIFSRYLHPDVISELIQHPDTVKLGGKEIRATILFTDIANFTTFSEGRKAPELIHYLNEYFNHLTAFILEYKGLLDKYTGDGIMAMFGAPLSREDNALLACRAALAHKRFAETLPSDETTAFLHQHTRIGINTGMIVAGNLGSHLRMDYTAIGDDVNLAARLEGVNKVYKTNIMISGNTYEPVKNIMLCRELDTITVKGKHNTTTVYELLEENTPEMKQKYHWLDEFNQAVSLYKKGEWKQSLELFQSVRRSIPDDFPTNQFIKKCQNFLETSPKEWSCVVNLESK